MSSLYSPCDWVGSERICRACFRLAIGSALVVYVVPVFALRLGLALGASSFVEYEREAVAPFVRTLCR